MTIKQTANIIFSTTRQWNPGDEIILFGVQNILNATGKLRFNPIIFNRNPDLRQGFDGMELVKDSGEFFDNSIKPNTDCSVVDWAIFAGTPEWSNVRNYDLYTHIIENNIPVMILGVGGGCQIYKESFRDVISKAKLFTAREGDTFKAAVAQGFSVRQLPCPALLSAPKNKERNITKVDNIGLIYQASRNDSVFWGSLAQEAYDYQQSLLKRIIDRYHDEFNLSIVCHYVDEVPLAKKLFPNLNIMYSYNSSDYFDIYSQFDLVIGPRVHGIGAAASLGIPGIALAHDARGGTNAGFLADIITPRTSLDDVLAMIANNVADIERRNRALLSHKSQTLATFRDLVSSALDDPIVQYDAKVESKPAGDGGGQRLALSERLDRTDAALTEAQRLATERAGEVRNLAQRLDKTHAALEEMQTLATERYKETEALRASLAASEIGRGDADAALAEAQSLATKQAAEARSLSGRLDETHAALAEAQTLAAERYEEGEALRERTASLEFENAALLQRADAAETALASLYASRSWRFTALFRWLGGAPHR